MITDIEKDLDALTMSVTAEFDATPERVWQLWSDPRQLERWWGPPSYPATVLEHDLSENGRVNYLMTGPEGDTHRGWWRILSVDPPKALEFEDGFADDAGEPQPHMPTTIMRLDIDEIGAGRTRVVIVSRFPSREALDQLIGMGMEEGLREAMGQMDAIVAGSPV